MKLKEVGTQSKDAEKVQERELERGRNEEDVEAVWKELKDCLLGVAEEVCGSTKGPPRHKESWWWDEECSRAVVEKRRLYGIWQKTEKEKGEEGAKEEKSAYTKAKNEARSVIGKAKERERSRWVDELKTQGEKKRYSKLQKYWWRRMKMWREGGGCIKDEYGKVVMEEEKVRDVLVAYYEKLLNEEFDWNMKK